MWIELTNTNAESVLVNFKKVAYVSPRTGGGSTLHFWVNAIDKDPRTALGIREAVEEVFRLIWLGTAAFTVPAEFP